MAKNNQNLLVAARNKSQEMSVWERPIICVEKFQGHFHNTLMSEIKTLRGLSRLDFLLNHKKMSRSNK